MERPSRRRRRRPEPQARPPESDEERAVVEAVGSSQWTLISAPSGSASGRRVAGLVHHTLNGRYPAGLRLAVVVPLRLGVLSVAQAVAEAEGMAYTTCIRPEDRLNPSAPLHFLTDSMFVLQYQADPNLARYGAVVFLDAQESTVDGSLALSFARKTARRRKELRVVVVCSRRAADSLAAELEDSARVELEEEQAAPPTASPLLQAVVRELAAAVPAMLAVACVDLNAGCILTAVLGEPPLEGLEDGIAAAVGDFLQEGARSRRVRERARKVELLAPDAVGSTPGDAEDPETFQEAIGVGPDVVMIALRCRRKPDLALTVASARVNNLGMVLALARTGMADLEDVVLYESEALSPSEPPG